MNEQRSLKSRLTELLWDYQTELREKGTSTVDWAEKIVMMLDAEKSSLEAMVKELQRQVNEFATAVKILGERDAKILDLEGELAEAKSDCNSNMNIIKLVEAERDVLREALKPFASMYDSWCSTNGNPMMIADVDNLKKAKAALGKVDK